jgi:hypothetical protein
MNELFGEVIYSYTRQDMINDGELVDVTETAKEAGFKIPVGITRTVYEGYIVPSEEDNGQGQCEKGRLWDTLTLLFFGAKSNPRQQMFQYPITYVIEGKEQLKTLKAMIHPGDHHEPVLTVMLPSED